MYKTTQFTSGGYVQVSYYLYKIKLISQLITSCKSSPIETTTIGEIRSRDSRLDISHFPLFQKARWPD